ncbi:MAG: NAD+ synthase [Betaproteobacteria bacterium]|nr:NAD+ synthase [Betaproteobacteria bacterium]
MKIAAAQLNQTVADFEANCNRIVEAAHQALEQGAGILLTPELSLCGYPPEDLLLRPAFIDRCHEALVALGQQLQGLAIEVIVGLPHKAADGRLYNAAAWLRRGEVVAWYHKQALPNYDVFDEKRYFAAGHEVCVVETQGRRFGVLICEDFWTEAPCKALQAHHLDAVLILNASPFHINKQVQRIEVARKHLSELALPMGQDELVFDGCSFALNAQGSLVAQARAFEPDVLTLSLDRLHAAESAAPTVLPDEEEQVWNALVLGTRDYVLKNRFPGVLIGLSGGIDSAVTLAVAVDALGADRVRAVMMPSQYTADISWIDSRDMVARLGVRYDELPIRTLFEAYLSMLASDFGEKPQDATEENIQARIRGTLLMALSNKHGSLVLTTSNKSESAVGYTTLYGDMAGGFAVLKDVYKTLVYRLAHYRNRLSPVIPQRIIERPPSAELRPDQTDQDSLPPYDVLDDIIQRYMENNLSGDQLRPGGIDDAVIARVVRLIQINEYKRRQAAVGVRVTPRAWGRDWRYPITSGWR